MPTATTTLATTSTSPAAPTTVGDSLRKLATEYGNLAGALVASSAAGALTQRLLTAADVIMELAAPEADAAVNAGAGERAASLFTTASGRLTEGVAVLQAIQELPAASFSGVTFRRTVRRLADELEAATSKARARLKVLAAAALKAAGDKASDVVIEGAKEKLGKAAKVAMVVGGVGAGGALLTLLVWLATREEKKKKKKPKKKKG